MADIQRLEIIIWFLCVRVLETTLYAKIRDSYTLVCTLQHQFHFLVLGIA